SRKLYEFHFKNNVKFSDGSPLHPKDVKFSIHPAKPINKHSTLETLKKLDNLLLKNHHLLQITFKSPSNQLLNQLTQLTPFPIITPHSLQHPKLNPK
ncbi:ABC transporter substrate-binding protein, partial [Staphylococcus epidermidis]|uniref:ABC transporter substrate-binding protein n=1 Tax=Staphylococcus epidermidis TaxID=1282 RepID=UPI0021B2BD2F